MATSSPPVPRRKLVKAQIIRVYRGLPDSRAEQCRRDIRGPGYKADLKRFLDKTIPTYSPTLGEHVVEELSQPEAGKDDPLPSLREAVAALEAMKQKFIPGPVTRRTDTYTAGGVTTESQASGQGDFLFGKDKVKFDIKSPGNPEKKPETSRRRFIRSADTESLMENVRKVAKKLANEPGLIEVIDTSLLSDQEQELYMLALDNELKNDIDRSRVIEVSVPMYQTEKVTYSIRSIQYLSDPQVSKGALEDDNALGGLFGADDDEY